MDGWMHKWMDGWIDGWMDGWVGGETCEASFGDVCWLRRGTDAHAVALNE